MAFEKKWQAVSPRPFTSDGTALGVVTIASTAGFYVKQLIFLVATAQNPQQLQIKRVLSHTQLVVGPLDNRISGYTNISAYTVALGAMIGAGEEDKNNIPEKDHYNAIYEGDPIVADRVILVDEYGDLYTDANPLPIAFDGTVTVGNVVVEGHNGNSIEPNADGSINANIVQAPVTGHTVISKYNETVNVPSGSQTQIVSYTVPPAITAILQRIVTSGENVARYDVFLNGVAFDTQRTYFGGDFNAKFEFITGNNDGYTLQAGDVLSVKVLHNRPFVGNFNGRIQVLEIA